MAIVRSDLESLLAKLGVNSQLAAVAAAQRAGWTSPHTRRVRALWRALTRDQSRAIVRAASADSYDGDHWWRNTRDALDVVREVLGLMNTWAGLPLGQA